GPNTKNGKDSPLPLSKFDASVTPPIGEAMKSLSKAVLAIDCAVLIKLLSPVVRTGSKSKYKLLAKCAPLLLYFSIVFENNALTCSLSYSGIVRILKSASASSGTELT